MKTQIPLLVLARAEQAFRRRSDEIPGFEFSVDTLEHQPGIIQLLSRVSVDGQLRKVDCVTWVTFEAGTQYNWDSLVEGHFVAHRVQIEQWKGLLA